MHLKMSSARWLPFCLDLSLLSTDPVYITLVFIVPADVQAPVVAR